MEKGGAFLKKNFLSKVFKWIGLAGFGLIIIISAMQTYRVLTNGFPLFGDLFDTLWKLAHIFGFFFIIAAFLFYWKTYNNLTNSED